VAFITLFSYVYFPSQRIAYGMQLFECFIVILAWYFEMLESVQTI